MNKYEIGQVLEKLRGSAEGVRFDIADDGASLTICFETPNNQEIGDIKNGDLQFGLFVKDNIIFLLSKFGKMNWMDAPYHIALSKNLNTLLTIDEGLGYACNIALVDTRTGEIKALRLISFSTDFSRKLRGEIVEQSNKPFNNQEYSFNLNNIMKNYTTKDMVRLSISNCRIR